MSSWRPSHRTNVILLVTLIFIAGVAGGVIVQHLTSNSGSNARTVTKHSSDQSSRSLLQATSSDSRPSGPATASAPTTSAEVASELAPDAAATFASLQRQLPGPVEVAVMPVGTTTIVPFGPQEPAHGWSTTKIPVIAALMTAVAPHELSEGEQDEVRQAITESSNEAILSLFRSLEHIKGGLVGASEAVEIELRASGDRYTVVATQPPPPGAVTTFGQTEWSPEASVRFFSALDAGCLVTPSQTRRVLGLMQQIVPSESWGLGSAGFAHVAFKGGWGPEGATYLVRQSGVVDPATRDATAVAIVAHPPAGASSFAEGTEMLTRTAAWLRGVLHPVAHTVGCGEAIRPQAGT